MKLQHCLAAVAAACLTTVAGAAPITYTFTGVVTTNEGGTVTRDLQLVVTGDTDDVRAEPLVPPTDYWIVDSGLSYSLTIGGTAYSFDGSYGAIYVYNDVPDGIVGFGFENIVSDWLALTTNGELDAYDLKDSVTPVGAGLNDLGKPGLSLTGGPLAQLTFDSLSNVRFAAELIDGAVPEPGSFALAGLALAGLALTRRRA